MSSDFDNSTIESLKHGWDIVKGVLLAIVTGLISWGFWMGKRHVRRIDGHEQRLRDIEAAFVKEDMFNSTVDSLRRQMATDKDDLRQQISRGTEGTHRRLDELMLMLAREKNHGR